MINRPRKGLTLIKALHNGKEWKNWLVKDGLRPTIEHFKNIASFRFWEKSRTSAFAIVFFLVELISAPIKLIQDHLYYLDLIVSKFNCVLCLFFKFFFNNLYHKSSYQYQKFTYMMFFFYIGKTSAEYKYFHVFLG